MSVKIGVIGYQGRMGQEILQILQKRNVEAITFGGEIGGDKNEIFTKSDVVIDFTNNDGLKECLKFVEKTKTPFVSGSTPMNNELMAEILKLSQNSKICWSANMSIGIAITRKLASMCGKFLADYDCEIFERHHNKKKDAPSGTAIMLGKSVADGRGVEFDKVAVFDRNQERQKGQIGFSSVRGGNIVGDHDVMFIGEYDEIAITHRAYKRSLFAVGAVECALKLLDKKNNGFYTIEDLLLSE